MWWARPTLRPQHFLAFFGRGNAELATHPAGRDRQAGLVQRLDRSGQRAKVFRRFHFPAPPRHRRGIAKVGVQLVKIDEIIRRAELLGELIRRNERFRELRAAEKDVGDDREARETIEKLNEQREARKMTEEKIAEWVKTRIMQLELLDKETQ